jgi:hypothetical protein
MVVFVELPAEVALVRQAEDRAHRKGQAAKAVNVYFLCAQGTVDDKQWQALNTSLSHISQVRGTGMQQLCCQLVCCCFHTAPCDTPYTVHAPTHVVALALDSSLIHISRVTRQVLCSTQVVGCALRWWWLRSCHDAMAVLLFAVRHLGGFEVMRICCWLLAGA